MANEPMPANAAERKSSGPNSKMVTSTTTTTNNSRARDLIVMTSYAVEPGHTLISILRLKETDWRPEMKANASYIAEGDDAGIIINKKASMMDYSRNQNGQKQRQEPPNAKMSFKVFLINSETGKLTLEHRTLRFWLGQQSTEISINNNNNGHSAINNNESATNTNSLAASNLKQESSQLALAYFRKLIGSKPDDDFPKNYVDFLMKLMRLLKTNQFIRINKMEVELRQLAYEDNTGPPSRASSLDGSQSGCETGSHSGRGSPLTSQKILDIIESSYPNPISMRELCSTTQTDESLVRQFVDELAVKEKIQASDDGQLFTRTTKPIDTKVNLVKQMPKVVKSQQPVIAILTAQYCEKLAVDSMISDKETFVRYRTTVGGGGGSNNQDDLVSSNYVYTLGNIGDHRVVSTKLTSVGNSRASLIAAGNATTRLLGTFPDLEYVFLVGCAGGVANYTDFAAHVRLGDVVVSDLNASIGSAATGDSCNNTTKLPSNEYVYVHCRPKQPDAQQAANENRRSTTASSIPVSYSIHKNLKRAANCIQMEYRSFDDDRLSAAPGGEETSSKAVNDSANNNDRNKQLDYDECHFRLWRPARLDLQELAKRIWSDGMENAKHRIWEYYIDEGIKTLQQQDIEAARPPPDSDKLFMSIGMKDTIEVSHPEPADDEVDLRKGGRPMCHFGPIGSGCELASNEPLKQRMISEFGLRALDSEFDPVVESIYGNCKESYIMIRGICDYKDGRRKNKEWQQYSALVAAAFMKSIIVNLKPVE